MPLLIACQSKLNLAFQATSCVLISAEIRWPLRIRWLINSDRLIPSTPAMDDSVQAGAPPMAQN